MKREIKFKGLSIEKNEWVFGNLLLSEKTTSGYYKAFIAIPFADDANVSIVEIKPGTESQFTGLKDKNGKEIYEGDICEVDNNENANHLQTVNCNYAKQLKKGDLLIIKKLLSGFTGQILTNQGNQPNLIGNVCNYSLWNGARQLKVIGNVYQHPELLK